MNLPNIISLGRLIITPIILWLMLTGAYPGAFWLFFAAAASDAIDGAIAKRFDMVTVLGGYLDPIADKAMLVGVFLVLGSLGHLPLWIVLMVVSRDALIIGGALLLWMLERSFWMKPLMVSKVNTVCQILLAAIVLGGLGLEPMHDFTVTLGVMMDILMIVVAATTLVSGAAYLVMWARRVNHNDGGGET